MKLLSLYHLNLMYSAIEIERRHEVIKKCYWPLLDLCKDSKVKIALEMPAYTLEVINELEPEWVQELQTLTGQKKVELISCGYSQLIAPLVPYEVNLQNLKIGQKIYSELLNYTPKLGLINEQALSAGTLDSFIDCGFEAVIMEYNNVCLDEENWVPHAEKRPQKLKAASGRTITVIWNDSVKFQKFQRLAHNEASLNEYLNYFKQETCNYQDDDIFAIYGNDAEIFDFRPGRYMTEAKLDLFVEWKRIGQLYETLNSYMHILPSDILAKISPTHIIQLNAIAHPVRVKKQPKYNILRWAVSGVDDININAKCYQIYDALKNNTYDFDDWKKLCYLWSSDFRTHITKKRWDVYTEELNGFLSDVAMNEDIPPANTLDSGSTLFSGRYYDFKGERLNIQFDCQKGLSINFFCDHKVSDQALFGKVNHGEIKQITHSADFFSGNMIFEVPGSPKQTDLINVTPKIKHSTDETVLSFSADCEFGYLKKKWIIRDKIGELELQQTIIFDKGSRRGSLRLGVLTFLEGVTKVGDQIISHLGGGKEIFDISEDIRHGSPISMLVSANQGLPMTEGELEYVNDDFSLNLSVDVGRSPAIALCSFEKITKRRFHRIFFTVMECDDTSRTKTEEIDFKLVIKVKN